MGADRIAFVQGASRGIGLELVRQLLETGAASRVIASCREPDRATKLQSIAAEHMPRLTTLAVDVSEEATIAEAATRVGQVTDKLHFILNVAGVLHGEGFGPEKRLSQVRPEVLKTVFEVNAFGPLIVAKHFSSFLRHDDRSIFASLSARVGSISDNRLGGWYAYRGSKAAQNMFTKTLSIELGHVARNTIVVGLHPGTVDTGLSEPFQGSVPKEKLFSTKQSVEHLLAVIDGLTPQDTGKVFAWDGSEIPP
ncbi:MAG: SDR family oxidoreductase [Myxococcales bacterium]|nr:SDR family oxidoreductase [Myxococcales bacterium]MDH3483046.1 SDR family oxidoreductase [Myxococcales bacterium]